ncbi:UDP-3-O-(3-hydroxymyristoyl)glucosamine N-acyltransferase [uncultured Paludibaculum sp.]|uniref:UDP-3-O-(3-hydroxymyristoyl)glucosamine N-acyltransferase n=1 Tax=uncultured Paludibaculum sp. TaxID=1765020 RepID=UPI002AAB9D7C|nr:UDP-3-O-(3-hydroxymyristoyl)glucosamine N-acyltransferase [uncultured Paludibaculum sp.]
MREIAEQLSATFEGDGERPIEGVAPLDSAGSHQISFVGSRRAVRDAQASAAGCLIVGLDFANTGGRTVIRSKDPRAAFAKVIPRLQKLEVPEPGIHPTAVIGKDCHIGEGCTIGPYCVLGDRVELGANSRLYAHVTIYSDVTVGARALIHAGAVLGADGFGFVFENGHYSKFPQIGRVVIGDDVEIGVGSAVDRAALGVTSIGDGTKLDNMVHIGHNCRVGRHVVIVAQTGMAGGTVIEDYAVIGGQVGLGDNVTIKSGAVLGSGSGVLSSKIVRGGGEVYWGTPARPLKEYLEALANVARIPQLRREIAELQERLKALEKKEE